jgi:hypothetical protein
VIRSSRVRRILLGTTALVFVVIAALSLVRPHEMAAGLGYRLDNVDALSEHRAVYVGLWLAQAVLLLIALRRVEDAILGDLGALLVLGQVVGRVLSLCLDGAPSARVWPIGILEALGAVALLLVRPDAGRMG